MISREEGYTVAELLVVMVIFLVVIGITMTTFNRVVSNSGATVKRAETEIEGLIGLELLRVDLELAGIGLPWSFMGIVNYNEGPLGDPYNDANQPPRAVINGDGHGFNHSDYLVLKGTALGATKAARKWTFMTYSSPGAVSIRPSKTDLEFSPTDTAIAVRAEVRGRVPTKELVMSGSSCTFAFKDLFKDGVGNPLSDYAPKKNGDVYLVYGINDSGSVSIPYNRADYYLKVPDIINNRCAPKTGVLYKKVHNSNTYPLLDCVADFQVIFGFTQGSKPNHESDLHQDEVLHGDGSQATARDIREQVRELRVYILAHEGSKDPDYSYPSAKVTVGEFDHGSVFDLSQIRDYQHYRWKVYTIVVQPKNLM